jgi:hypothetical protein
MVWLGNAGSEAVSASHQILILSTPTFAGAVTEDSVIAHIINI